MIPLRNNFALTLAVLWCGPWIAGALAAPETASQPTASTTETRMRVHGLQTEYLSNPLGLDARRPRLTWTVLSNTRGDAPTAYHVLVASSPDALEKGRGDVWDSGRVSSTDPMAVYAGKPLASRARCHWKVRCWDREGKPTPWSRPASFEMGLLDPADWKADWIGAPDQPAAEPDTLGFPARKARYIRIRVTRLGVALPLTVEGPAEPRPRLQLAEVEVFHGAADARRNIALHAPVAASEKVDNVQEWDPSYLTNGDRTTDEMPAGYSSLPHPSRDVSETPVWIEVDLGADREFDTVVLYPRTDYASMEGGTPNFPTDFTIETRADGASEYQVAKSVTDRPAPARHGRAPLPLLARDFTLNKPARRARLYVTGLGRYEAHLNGAKVGHDELEPGDTDYRKTVAYATYDVTDGLKTGANTLGMMLANGFYNLRSEPGRYHKLTNVWGGPRAKALLVVEHADGSQTRIATDERWRWAPGPILYSGHYGGEDYDARAEFADWDAPGFKRSDWKPVEVIEWSEAAPRLVARRQPPVRIVDTLKPVAISEPAQGIYVVDFGQNMAGIPELRVTGARGTVVRLRPSEVLHKDGTVDQSTTGSPIFDTYTLKGEGVESWRPRFMYHGFRYLEVTGLPGGPKTENLRAHIIRANNPRHGSFASSNELLNRIHNLIDAATISNMTNVLTDCPHREKLGWLEVSHLMFESIAFNFDTTAWYEKILADMRDAQLADGMVPDIAPEYTIFHGGFRDDPNWGGASVFVPWYLYEATGDRRALAGHYEVMRRYLDYLTGKADGHILSHGLGDWIAPDATTPLPLVATTSYFRQARIMARAARLLGRNEDAERYDALAERIASAFNARFYNPETQSYGSGSQASNALPLHGGLVPEDRREQALATLVTSLEKAGNHMTTGEIGLPAVLLSLMAGGREDVIYAFANLKEHPSYGYQVAHGATTLTEAWDGPESADPNHDGPVISQNHCMLGHIEEWFYSGLAGLRRTAPAWRTLDIRPYVPEGLEWVKAETDTVRGRLASAWRKSADGVFTLDVTIPAGSVATLYIPAKSQDAVYEGDHAANVAKGVAFLRMEGGCAVYRVESGAYTFVSR